MLATLDMNNEQLINLPEPTEPTSAVRLVDLQDATFGSGVVISQGPLSTTAFDDMVVSTIQRELDATLSIYRFGNPLLTVDWTAAFNAAAKTGKTVFVPAGTYNVSGPLEFYTSNSGLHGEGRATRIIHTHATGNLFQVGNGIVEVSGMHFSNFTVWASVTKTDGWVFHNQMVTDSYFYKIEAGAIDDYVSSGNAHRLWNGYYFDRFSQCALHAGQVVTAQIQGQCRGNVGNDFGAELSIDGGIRFFNGHRGFIVGGGAGGVYFGRMDITGANVGVVIDQSLQNTYNREAFFSSFCTIDSCVNAGVIIDQTTLSLGRILFDNTWICGTTAGPGLWIQNFNDGRVHVSLHCYSNDGDGVRIDDSSTYVFISDDNFFDINGGYAINATVATTRLTVSLPFSLANGSGAFNDTFNGRSVSVSSGVNKGVVINGDGALEITAGVPYIDFKDTTAEDYDVRIIKNGPALVIQSNVSSVLNLSDGTPALQIAGIGVVGARQTGWAADTGTAKRTTNATYTGTAEVGYTQATVQALMDKVRDLSQTIKALKDDMITHGLIGA